MSRSTGKRAASSTTGTANSSTPLVDPVTYTDGVGFEAGNSAKSDKYRTASGKVVDDLKGEPGWQLVVKGDRVTPEIARMIADGGPDMNAGDLHAADGS